MTDIHQRLTNAIRLAEQQIANANFHAETIGWLTVLEVMRDARQALAAHPTAQTINPFSTEAIASNAAQTAIQPAIAKPPKQNG